MSSSIVQPSSASTTQVIDVARKFLSTLDQTASSNSDILTPLINYYNTFINTSSTKQLIPIIGKITWKYIFHPLLDIYTVISHREWFIQFPIEKEMPYSDWVMVMNNTAVDICTDQENKGNFELAICKSFLGYIGVFLSKFMSVKDQKSEGQGSLFDLVELYFRDGLSKKLTKQMINYYSYMKEFINKQDTNLCKVMYGDSEPFQLNIENSFKLVLETLDHGITEKLNCRVLEKLGVAIETIHQFELNTILQTFNKLNCRTSLVMTLGYLNYILSYNISFHNLDTLPNTIISQFQCFTLPPIAKSEEQEEKQGIDKLIEMIIENEIPENLTIIQFRIIQLLARFLPQESLTIEHISQIKNENLTNKIENSFIELIIASIISSLLLNNQSNYKQTIIHATFHTLLSVKFTRTNQPWIILINTANDICYADLKYIPNFITLFEYLMKRNPSVMNDELIKSGLNFFIDTFDPDYKWFTKREQQQQQQQTYEIKLDDYKYLYPELVTTPNVKPGRQQSVHVDMFK